MYLGDIMVLFGFGVLEMLVGVVLFAMAVGGVIWAINSRYLSVGFNVAKANLGEAASNLEAENAVKLMKQGIVECTEQVQKAKQGLVKVQASIAILERQVKDGTNEELRLKKRIEDAIAEGKQNTDPVLKQYATNLKRVRDDLKTNKKQLQTQHDIYNDLLAQIGNAQRSAENYEKEANSIGAQLETSKLTAELSDFANSFDAKGVNASLDGVAKYRELARRQIDANNAKMKVNRDLGSNGSEVQSWENEQDTNDILSEFRKPKTDA